MVDLRRDDLGRRRPGDVAEPRPDRRARGPRRLAGRRPAGQHHPGRPVRGRRGGRRRLGLAVAQQPLARAQAHRRGRGDRAAAARPPSWTGAWSDGPARQEEARAARFPELTPVPAMADLPKAKLQSPARYLGTLTEDGEKVIGQSLSVQSSSRLNLSPGGARRGADGRVVPDPGRLAARCHHGRGVRRQARGVAARGPLGARRAAAVAHRLPDGRRTRTSRPGRRHRTWTSGYARSRRWPARLGETNDRGDPRPRGRAGVPRRVLRGARGDVRRGGVLDRHDRLPGDAHRPVVPPAGRGDDQPARRQHRHQRRGPGVAPDLGERVRRPRPLAGPVQLALGALARRRAARPGRRRHQRHRHPRPDPAPARARRDAGRDLLRQRPTRRAARRGSRSPPR